MNYLAHAFLSGDGDAFLIGNLTTDMMSYAELKSVPETLKPGIQLHHWIDDFADAHVLNKQAKEILRPAHGKFAPVTLDVFQDYLLYRSWDRWSQRSFHNWKEEVYTHIRLGIPGEEFGPVSRLRRMAESDWLRMYTTHGRIQRVFDRLGAYRSYSHPFATALDALSAHEDQLQTLFEKFFEEMLRACAEYRQETSLRD